MKYPYAPMVKRILGSICLINALSLIMANHPDTSIFDVTVKVKSPWSLAS